MMSIRSIQFVNVHCRLYISSWSYVTVKPFYADEEAIWPICEGTLLTVLIAITLKTLNYFCK
jgi:hypothetical protein